MQQDSSLSVQQREEGTNKGICIAGMMYYHVVYTCATVSLHHRSWASWHMTASLTTPT